jgi:fumarate reductase flavoprotein subunit
MADLADQAGLPGRALERTVVAFNAFCRDGAPLTPHRSGHPRPIEQPPYHAIPLIPGIYFTMGGVLVNGHGQALDRQEQPIPGLYAAGGTMGGLQGGPHLGYTGGWSEASTFGILSAEHAMAYAADLTPRTVVTGV